MLTGFSPHRRPVLKQSTLYHPSLIFWRTVHMSTFNVCRIIFWYKFLVCLLFVTSLFSFLPEASLHKLQDTYYGEEANLKFWSFGIFFFFFLSFFVFDCSLQDLKFLDQGLNPGRDRAVKVLNLSQKFLSFWNFSDKQAEALALSISKHPGLC